MKMDVIDWNESIVVLKTRFESVSQISYKLYYRFALFIRIMKLGLLCKLLYSLCRQYAKFPLNFVEITINGSIDYEVKYTKTCPSSVKSMQGLTLLSKFLGLATEESAKSFSSVRVFTDQSI